MTYTRLEIATDLKRLFQSIPEVIAVWEGGSAATGYLDAYSDLDLSIVCEDHAVEFVMESVKNRLEKQYGILRFYRVPEPAWHGFSQCYYQIDQVPALFYLDIAVIKQSIPDKFTASDRHGHAVIWFENKPMMDSSPTLQTTTDALCRRIFKTITQLDFLLELEARKGLARQVYSEAFPAYYTFLARIVVPMMNLKHRPAKADFGFRYIYRDFPKTEALRLEGWLKATTVQDLCNHFEQIVSLYRNLKKELTFYSQPTDSLMNNQASH